MASLDRQAWADGLAVVSFGVRLGVRVDDAAILPRVRARLPPLHRRSRDRVVDHLYSIRISRTATNPGIRHFHLVYAGPSLVGRTLDEAEAWEAFESAARFDVASSATAFTFVHAGVVAWDGRAIVIPGSSRSGKSRLTEALVRAGAEYYSDEFAAFDRRGRVHPFPKPLSIREPSGGCRRVTAEDLGGRVGSRPIRVGLVVSSSYREGASWGPRTATPGEGVLRLLEHTVRARTAPAESLRTLARAVEGASTLVGERDEASAIVPFLLKAASSLTRA